MSLLPGPCQPGLHFLIREPGVEPMESHLPRGGYSGPGRSVVSRAAQQDVAIFRNGEDRIFALLDRCPHKGGPLWQGIVFGEHVACPLHNWNIELQSGCAVAPDQGCTQKFSVKVEDGQVYLDIVELN